jgi:catechol 2,3-dioxygenase
LALSGVLRAGQVQLRVLDMAAAIDHYEKRIGLDMVGREADGRVYLKGRDEFDRHSVILRETDRAGIDLLAFKVADPDTLRSLRQGVADWGLAVDDIPAGDLPGVGPRVGFTIPSGHRIELYAEIEMAARHPSLHNPDVWSEEPHGMRASRFDHALLYGPDIEKVVALFTDVLGFSCAERVGTAQAPVAAWLAAANKPHDLALVRSCEAGKLHHIAFHLDSWSDIGYAADLMTRYNITIDSGPTRHGITRGQTIYFFDPSGNRNEVSTGGYIYYPDHPTRVWDEEAIGKGIFYYERELNDRFMTVVT